MSDLSSAPTSSAPALSTPEEYLEAVHAAVAERDLARAGQISDAALQRGLRHPLMFKMRGLLNEGRGQLEAAAQDFRSALEMTPDDAGALNALGLCLARLGRPREAVIELDRALQVMPNFAGAAANKGWALESMGDLAAAREAYAHASELEPANASVLASLASLGARTGDPQSREFAERALAIDPDEPVAAMALAMGEVASGEFEQAELRLGRMLTRSDRLGAHARAVAEGLRADALDGQGKVEEAFSAYQAENEILRNLHQGRFAPGRPESGADYVRRLNAYVQASDPAEWRTPEIGGGSTVDSPAAKHVFLLGFPRSGTTLLGQVLAAHPQVETLDERETLIDAVQAFMVNPEDLQRLKDQPPSGLDYYRDAYWRRVREAAAAPEGKVFVDKLPMNTLKLPLIARMFPHAIVLLARRDPRDVVLSCFRRHFVTNPTTWEFLTLEGAARYYDAVSELTLLLDERLPLQLRPQRHEGLVEDFEGQSRALCKTLGLPWTEDMANFAEGSRARQISTPSARQVAAGLSDQGVGAWRRYAEQLAPVLPILQPWVERFGYSAA